MSNPSPSVTLLIYGSTSASLTAFCRAVHGDELQIPLERTQGRPDRAEWVGYIPIDNFLLCLLDETGIPISNRGFPWYIQYPGTYQLSLQDLSLRTVDEGGLARSPSTEEEAITQSRLNIWSPSLPGLSDKHQKAQIPFYALPNSSFLSQSAYATEFQSQLDSTYQAFDQLALATPNEDPKSFKPSSISSDINSTQNTYERASADGSVSLTNGANPTRVNHGSDEASHDQDDSPRRSSTTPPVFLAANQGSPLQRPLHSGPGSGSGAAHAAHHTYPSDGVRRTSSTPSSNSKPTSNTSPTTSSSTPPVYAHRTSSETFTEPDHSTPHINSHSPVSMPNSPWASLRTLSPMPYGHSDIS
eukprot:TRINITY_DN15771_c0_g1::TRINITY_DN15771_c0_g1_i1::g.25486::m.25486 TRINITY_DN15771_c0_g1::TRINITY_DN15771_c0_g1_i1::g.25486  ORF type:complete len:358 (+),score=4.03 TRINITY_DN15771_c0_g1_i1:160-1233(+)